MLNIEENKNKFIEIFNNEIYREGKEELLEWLNKSDFFTAPATGQYSLSQKGGLCKRSLNIYRTLSELVSKYREEDKFFLLDLPASYTEEDYNLAVKELNQSIAIIGLLSDICIANCWVDSIKNVQQPDGKWIKKPSFKWEEEFIFGHGAKSVFIIQQFMRLYVEEAQAIRYHEQGKEVPYGDSIETAFYQVYENTPLAALTGVAVNEATFIRDRKDTILYGEQ